MSEPANEDARTTLSSDGAWWWDGTKWIAAVSADGLWRWNGEEWQPTIPMDPGSHSELAATLALMAEERYAQAGALLAARESEWEPDQHLRNLIGRSYETHARLRRIESGLANLGGQGLGGVWSRVGPRRVERRRLEDERDRLNSELRPLLVYIGRGAPQPSIKEADEILSVARFLDDRAALLNSALAQLQDAEDARAERVAAAHRELRAAQESREAAIDDARRRVAEAEAEHHQAVSEPRSRLAALRMPGLGDPLAEFAGVRLHTRGLESAAGRLPVDGASAELAPASELWRRHGPAISDLLLVGAEGAGKLNEALVRGESDHFLLIRTRAGSLLRHCPPELKAEADAFRRRFTRTARAAAKARAELETAIANAERELEKALAERAPLEAARAELARVENDPALLSAVEKAQARLAEAEADGGELRPARAKLADVVAELTRPPELLRPAPIG